jgi:hypothetical protein
MERELRDAAGPELRRATGGFAASLFLVKRRDLAKR